MAKRTEIVVEKHVSLFEHRFISGVADSESQLLCGLREHRILKTPEEHRTLSSPEEHRKFGIASEHRSLDPGEEPDPSILDQATLKLSNPHKVSTLTVQRRRDGSFFLIIEE